MGQQPREGEDDGRAEASWRNAEDGAAAAPVKRGGRGRAAKASSSTSGGKEGGRRTTQSGSTAMDAKAEGTSRREAGGVRRDAHRPERRPRGLGRKWGTSTGALHRWFLQTRHWAEQDPTLLAVKMAVLRLLDKVVPFFSRVQGRADVIIQRYWPAVEKWGVFVGRLLLIITFATLECTVRGVKSLFRLSSAALCLTLWCCILNVTALAGFLSVSIVMGVTAAASFFLGITPGFAILGIFGAVVVWMYGSFWTTAAFILISGILGLKSKGAQLCPAALFLADLGKTASMVIMLYSSYSAKVYGGWLGLTVCTSLAFVSSDLVIHFLSNIEEKKGSSHGENAHDQYGRSRSAPKVNPQAGSGPSSVHSTPGEARRNMADESEPSISGAPDVDQTAAEEEVARVLGCSDHYAVLGFSRLENCDETVLKREYRKKAMLVHPDKNKGNARAEEAFKRLQNAYEVLLDNVKKKSYDDDLRREELIMNFRRNGFGFHKNGRCASADCACHTYQEEEGEPEVIGARPIVCRTCKQMHMWIPTDRDKQHARWCQECQEYHPAKDGDGWVEQSGQSFFFGLFQKVDLPQAYACAGSLVYNVTEWAICQGMKCPANTHKPSFYVSTASPGRNTGSKSSKSGTRGNMADGFQFPDLDENMSDEDFYEWLERAMAAGLFNDMNGGGKQAAAAAGKSNNNRRKKKGNKKQW